MGTIATPSALSFGMPQAGPPAIPYQAPRPQVRQGSFTPAPSTQSNSVHRPSVAQLNFPARLGSMNNIPYAAPALGPARDTAFQNRSWTPLPVPSVLAGLDR